MADYLVISIISGSSAYIKQTRIKLLLMLANVICVCRMPWCYTALHCVSNCRLQDKVSWFSFTVYSALIMMRLLQMLGFSSLLDAGFHGQHYLMWSVDV